MLPCVLATAGAPEEHARPPVGRDLRLAQPGAAPVVPLPLRALRKHGPAVGHRVAFLQALEVEVDHHRLARAALQLYDARDFVLVYAHLQAGAQEPVWLS